MHGRVLMNKDQSSSPRSWPPKLSNVTSADHLLPLTWSKIWLRNWASSVPCPTLLPVLTWPTFEDWHDYILCTAILSLHQITAMGKMKLILLFSTHILSHVCMISGMQISSDVCMNASKIQALTHCSCSVVFVINIITYL